MIDSSYCFEMDFSDYNCNTNMNASDSIPIDWGKYDMNQVLTSCLYSVRLEPIPQKIS